MADASPRGPFKEPSNRADEVMKKALACGLPPLPPTKRSFFLTDTDLQQQSKGKERSIELARNVSRMQARRRYPTPSTGRTSLFLPPVTMGHMSSGYISKMAAAENSVTAPLTRLIAEASSLESASNNVLAELGSSDFNFPTRSGLAERGQQFGVVQSQIAGLQRALALQGAVYDDGLEGNQGGAAFQRAERDPAKKKWIPPKAKPPKTYVGKKIHRLKQNDDEWDNFTVEMDRAMRERRVYDVDVIARNVGAVGTYSPTEKKKRMREMFDDARRSEEQHRVRQKQILADFIGGIKKREDINAERLERRQSQWLEILTFIASCGQIISFVRHVRQQQFTSEHTKAARTIQNAWRHSRATESDVHRGLRYARSIVTLSRFVNRAKKKKRLQFRHVAADRVRCFMKSLPVQALFFYKMKSIVRSVRLLQKVWRSYRCRSVAVLDLLCRQWDEAVKARVADLSLLVDKLEKEASKSTRIANEVEASKKELVALDNIPETIRVQFLKEHVLEVVKNRAKLPVLERNTVPMLVQKINLMALIKAGCRSAPLPRKTSQAQLKRGPGSFRFRKR